MSKLKVLAPVLLPLALGGCPTRDVSALDPKPAIEVPNTIPVSSNRNVDILFLIDNSDSMKDKQVQLNTNFPRFIDVLKTIPGGLPNVHIAVTSSGVNFGMYSISGCGLDAEDGLLQNTPHPVSPATTCPVMNAGARFIEDIADPANPPNGRIRNYPGTAQLEQVFACIANLGTGGCGFEHHFEGIKRALDGRHAENTGFLRRDAYLAVVILADEDDCSAQDFTVFNPSQSLNTVTSPLGPFASYRCTEFGVTCDGLPVLPRAAADYVSCQPRGDSYLFHPQHYVDFLKGLKDDPNLVMAAIIGGNPTPFGVSVAGNGVPSLKHSCTATIGGNMNVADPGVRFKYFTDQFGQQGKIISICQPDFTDALTQIGRLLAAVVGTPCLDGPIDTTDIDPVSPGTQLNCTVTDVRFPNTDHEVQTVVPRCQMQPGANAGTNPPCTTGPCPKSPQPTCWWTRVNATTCPAVLSPTNTEFHTERWGTTPLVGTYTQIRCVSAAP